MELLERIKSGAIQRSQKENQKKELTGILRLLEIVEEEAETLDNLNGDLAELVVSEYVQEEFQHISFAEKAFCGVFHKD